MSALAIEAPWAAMMRQELVRRLREAASLAISRDFEARRTWIYFVRAGDAVKIGHARDVEARLRLIRVDNPTEVVLLARISGTVRGEREIQRRFEHLRIRGEWFRSERELLEFATVCQLSQERRDAWRDAEPELFA